VDPALWELLRADAGTDGTEIIEAIIRFDQPGIEIPDVRIVSRFGAIATCRIRARDVIAVRARPDVLSIKAARGLSPGFEPDRPETPGPAQPGLRPTDVRRSPTLSLTGAGVVVASADWGVDVDSAAFRWPSAPATADAERRPGGTRFLSFWDQRDQAAGLRPEPYGYGAVHDRGEIDDALRGRRPYELLGYHPAIADPAGLGTHGTHVLDIAAGNGGGGGPVGVAPDADLIFVHLADRNTGGLASFGDSVRLLEAVDFISGAAGSQPCVINISAGRICGPKDGTTLVERAFDELLTATPGRFIVNSAGNYFRRRAHARGILAPEEERSLNFVVDPTDITLNELEIWYDGADEFAVRVDPPGYSGSRAIGLGERSELLVEGRVIGRVYHREHDPNNGDNHIVAFIDPVGQAGNWTVTLEARRVGSGRFDAWIERDDSCAGCQARFTRDDSNSATTIGSIATSHLPLIVAAYDGHDPVRPAAPFSSRGPSRDLRLKPDLAAPGVAVLAARSAPITASRNPGLLTRKSGTSMATPHVTGAVALCLQAAGNQLSADAIRSLVLGSCDPVPDSDPYRLGRGYLNVPRLITDVQQALAAAAAAPGAKEPTMDATDSTVLLAAAPDTAYREFLYRPDGRFARWIAKRFDVVARPDQPIRRAPRAGDVLLEVSLGHMTRGQCATLAEHDLALLASWPRLMPGQLLLRPRRQLEVSAPLPVEPAIPAQVERVIEADREREAIEAVPGLPVGAEADEVGAAGGWQPWQDLIVHQVPRPVASDLARRGISIPKLSDAYGDINLDYYSVRISKLPSLHGTQMTPETLLEHIRRNIDNFVDTNNSSFPPLDASIDGPRWQSSNPLGAAINIHINALSFLKPRRAYIDQSLVVCSRTEPRSWIFTTAQSKAAGYHPVTGNRMWGIRDEDNGWVLFTRGADRATQFIDWVENIVGSLWAGADALWRSFQARVAAFINANQGAATVMNPVSKRWAWAAIQSQLPPAPAGESALSEFADAEAAESDDASEADYLGGRLWTFTAQTLALRVAVFCSRAALLQDKVEVLLFAHGLPRCPGPSRVPAGFVTEPPFDLGRIVHGSGRPIVLVVPQLDWLHPGGRGAFGAGHERWHALAKPENLNGLLAEVQAELGHVQAIAAPTVTDLVIAGHSRAYDFLEPLAYSRDDPAMQQGALAHLSRIGAFDTTYDGTMEIERWIDWLKEEPRLRVHVFYRPGSLTHRLGDEFYRQRTERLAVTPVGGEHCDVPATQLRGLLKPHGNAGTGPAEGQPEAQEQAPAPAAPAPAAPAPAPAAPGSHAMVRVFGQQPYGYLRVPVADMAQGIDVSHHNGAIDWARVAAAGTAFAYIKATEGADTPDQRFAHNWAEALAHRIPRGAYHLLTRPTQSTPAAQARAFLNQVTLLHGDMPPAIDLEPNRLAQIIADVGVADAWRHIWAWCQIVQDATGFKPLLYISKDGIDSLHGNVGSLPALDLWMPRYRPVQDPPPLPLDGAGNLVFPHWSVWQHSETGAVDGIPQPGVDLDLFNGNAHDLAEWIRNVQPTP
jgi:GH25 family lysozyme M1 (1,4-beta-N-acetylmuramidase)